MDVKNICLCLIKLTLFHLVFLFAGLKSSKVKVRTNDVPDLPLLILISMDGFRHDYLDPDRISASETPNFHYFIDNGVKAKYVMNVYPSNTFPNHMSILTGTYPETHGVVNNYFYDPILRKIFNMHNKEQNLYGSEFFDNGAEPIWVTNDMQGSGRRSGSILWPGGLTSVKGIKPRTVPDMYLYTSDEDFTYNARIDELIRWFKDENDPINLGLLYFDEPDEVGHHHGPDSKELHDKIMELDDALGYLKSKLQENGLFDRMNFIITSDHGMTTLNKPCFIDIDKYLNKTWYKAMSGWGGIVPEIVPLKEYEQEVITALFGKDHGNPINGKEHDLFYAWMKDGDQMKKQHYSKNRRIMKIILEAKKGYKFSLNGVATHGYDPNKVKDVLPFFIASGPTFKKGIVKERFNMVDIYPLMCQILGIDPAPNDGDLTHAYEFLVDPPHASTTHIIQTITNFPAMAVIVVTVAVFVCGVFTIGVCYQQRINKAKRHRKNRVIRMECPSVPESAAMLGDSEDEDNF